MRIGNRQSGENRTDGHTDEYSLLGASRLQCDRFAVPEATYIARTLAHPGAVGDMRETLQKCFKEPVLYVGQHIFITVKREEESSDTTVSAELGGLTPDRSPEQSLGNSPEPPPRKFRTIYDVQVWIQENWPEFKLDETREVEWPRWR